MAPGLNSRSGNYSKRLADLESDLSDIARLMAKYPDSPRQAYRAEEAKHLREQIAETKKIMTELEESV